MYIIVVGAGRTGSKVIELATQNDHEVVAVERRSEERRVGKECRL